MTVSQLREQLASLSDDMPVEKVSDGYHTFGELYDHRIALYVALCRFVNSKQRNDRFDSTGKQRRVWRSFKHHDGSSYDGWFILGIDRYRGEQITYHLPISQWEQTNFAVTLECAPIWDGHSSADVLERLRSLV